MKTTLLFGVVSVVLALVFYTVAVWSQRSARTLRPWHMALFWIGFVFDTAGTALMGSIAGKITFDLHGIIGILAIGLMLVNAVGASVVLASRRESWLRNFFWFSLCVWLVWLASFLTGMIGSMAHA